MSTNDVNRRGDFLTMAVPAAAAVASGDVLIFGSAGSPSYNIAGIAENAYTPPGSRVTTGNVGVAFVGVFLLSVVGKSTIDPGTGATIRVGDPVFADGGTYDATTGCTYGCTLNTNSTRGYLVGFALDPVTSGSTTTIRVKLKGGR